MKHYATQRFWGSYAKLPAAIRSHAGQQYERLKADPNHPSLHFKKIGDRFRSVRIGLHYRALAVERGDDCVWFWIGTHAEYDRLIR